MKKSRKRIGNRLGLCCQFLDAPIKFRQATHRYVASLHPALENDDRRFTPASLLPLCERLAVPLVYDVHHHRCNPDTLTVEEATELAEATWRTREPHFHISSPRDGWGAKDPCPHADFVTPDDFPDAWRGRRLTIDVEAKAKERAVIALGDALSSKPTTS